MVAGWPLQPFMKCFIQSELFTILGKEKEIELLLIIDALPHTQKMGLISLN